MSAMESTRPRLAHHLGCLLVRSDAADAVVCRIAQPAFFAGDPWGDPHGTATYPQASLWRHGAGYLLRVSAWEAPAYGYASAYEHGVRWYASDDLRAWHEREASEAEPPGEPLDHLDGEREWETRALEG